MSEKMLRVDDDKRIARAVYQAMTESRIRQSGDHWEIILDDRRMYTKYGYGPSLNILYRWRLNRALELLGYQRLSVDILALKRDSPNFALFDTIKALIAGRGGKR